MLLLIVQHPSAKRLGKVRRASFMTEMDKEESTSRKEMRDKRKDKLEGVHGDQKKTKSKLEQEREKVTKLIEGMYTTTETKVKTRLAGLEKENEERFGKSVLRFTKEFKAEVQTKLDAFMSKRHAGVIGKLRAAKDWFYGVDEFPEVKKFFKDAKDNYISKLDIEIASIIQYNNDVIKGCKACPERSRGNSSKTGKDEIDKFVSKLSPSLIDAGKKAAGEMAKKFAELDTFINEKQKALVDKLCAMKDKAIEHIDKVAEAMKVELSGALSKLIGLVVAALLKFFNWALGLFGYGMDNLEATIAKTKRTLTFIVKHPIDFMGGLFTAVGKGFSQFGDNIQKHLLNGLVMWLTGGMREEPIRLPEVWDLKGIIFFIMEVLGLTWSNIRMKLVKHVGEKTMSLAEKGVGIVVKLFTEGPIAMWEDLKNQGEELKAEIFGAVREMIIVEVVKQGVIFLLSLTNPASGIVKAIKAIYDFVMWFINNIQRIMEMVKKIFDSASNIVEGNYGEAANAIEKVMGITIPVVIDLFLGILGLGGLPRKVMDVIKKVGGKINAIIDMLLLKVVGVIKNMFGGKKGGGSGSGSGGNKGGSKKPGGSKKSYKPKKKPKGGGKKKGDKKPKDGKPKKPKDKKKKGAGKLPTWWTRKRSIPSSKEPGHNLLFKGTKDSAKIFVRSNEKSPEEVIKTSGLTDPQKKTALGEIKKMRSEITNVKRRYKALSRLAKGDAQCRSRASDQLDNSLGVLDVDMSKSATHIGIAFNTGATPLPKETQYDYHADSGRSGKIEVRFICKNTKAAAHSTGAEVKGWKDLQMANFTQNSDKYVKMHMVNAKLGGVDRFENFVSGKSAVNTGVKMRTFEKKLLQAANSTKNTVMWMTSRVEYYSNSDGAKWYTGGSKEIHINGNRITPMASNYAKKLEWKAGFYVPVGSKGDNSDWKKESNAVYNATFGNADLPLPNFVDNEKPLFNTATRARLLQLAQDNGSSSAEAKLGFQADVLAKAQNIRPERYSSAADFGIKVTAKLGSSDGVTRLIRIVSQLENNITL